MLGDVPSHWKKIAMTIAPVINTLIENFEKKNEGQIQSLGGEIRGLLEENGLSYTETVHHSRVGVSSVNRDDEMLQPDNAHNLVFIFTRKGFNAAESMNAFASEMPDGKEGEQELRKNRELIDKCAGSLPDYHVEDIKILTVAGSHTTTAIRIVDSAEKQRIRTIDALKHMCVNGFLSRAKILETTPSLVAPASTGMRYTIARKQIVKLCPRMMRILSEADNAKHSNDQKQTPIQTMFNIHRRATGQKAGTDAEWAQVVQQVSRSQDDAFLLDAKCYADFVREYSGGVSPTIL